MAIKLHAYCNCQLGKW